MKQKYKLLAIIIAALLLISALPLAAFADEYEETDAYGNAVTEYQESETIAESDTNETSAIQDGEIESDTETDIAITDEIESFVFEYSEKDELPTLSRMIGDGGVDLGPPEDDSTTTVVTSSIIPDGIYAIESVFAPGLWVDVNDVTVGGAWIWQDCHNIYPTNSFERSALFKIRYIEETNSYVIRLMTNNMLTLTFEDTNRLITKTISSPYDESVPVEETFVITRVSGAYIIKQYGDDTRALASRSPNGGEVNSPDSILVRESTGIAQDKAKWKLYKYTGTDRHGMTVYSSASYRNDGIPVGSTGVLRNITWSTVTGSNIPHMQAASNSAEMISTSYNYNLGEMSFTALSPGYATIQSMILKESTGISQYTERVYFQIIPEEGTYLIRNSGSMSYIDIKGPNKNEGTLLHQWTYSEKLWRRWIIEHVPNGEGYVRIKSAYSDKYIGVDSTTNTIIKQTSTLDDYSLWKLERASSGNLKLVCKALSSTVALAVPQGTDIDDNGTNLTTVAYTNNNYYNDEWELKQILPLSGYELDYDASKWVEYAENCCNCYAYALNNQVVPGTNYLWFKQQMGQLYAIDYVCYDYIESIIYQDVCNDIYAYNTEFGTSLIFQRIGRYETCPVGTYKIALVFKPATNANDRIDYHWYRQDSDGLWSHKQGITEVKRIDESGELIFDPYTADRGAYTEFLGYYAVTPWNNLFTPGEINECVVIIDGEAYIVDYDYLLSLLNQPASIENRGNSQPTQRHLYSNCLTSFDRSISDKIKSRLVNQAVPFDDRYNKE